jgi:hypothetical protein
MGVPGSCPDETKQPGTAGGPCRQDGDACDGEMRCYHETCWPCGGPDQLCCSGAGSLYCPNMANGDCNNTLDVEYPICESSCGGIGEACCATGDPCESIGTCTNGTCESPISASCFSGGDPVLAHVIDGGCKKYPVTFHVNTPAEATSCVQELLALAQSDPTLVQPVEVGLGHPTEEWWCPNVTLEFGAKKLFYFTQTQLQACWAFHDDDATWTQGECPG